MFDERNPRVVCFASGCEIMCLGTRRSRKVTAVASSPDTRRKFNTSTYCGSVIMVLLCHSGVVVGVVMHNMNSTLVGINSSTFTSSAKHSPCLLVKSIVSASRSVCTRTYHKSVECDG
jgi:hypothetical protein